MIKAVVFDIGGVLQDYKFSILKMRKHTHLSIHDFMARKLRISLDQWFDAIDTAYAKAIEGKITKAKELQIISKNVKASPKHIEKLWIMAYKKYFRRNDGLYELAYDLQKEGYKIGILSDQHHISKEALIPAEESKNFNIALISCDAGLRKPNPKFYLLALRALKMKPAEVVFIDNQIWNTKPAQKLGMKAIVFKNNKQTLKELRNLGVYI